MNAEAGANPRNNFAKILDMMPSELISLAVADVRSVMASKSVRVDMNTWGEFRGGTCYVCMAGAVFLQEAGRSCLYGNSFPDRQHGHIRSVYFKDIMPLTRYEGSREDAIKIKRRILALDHFRAGYWHNAFTAFDIEICRIPPLLKDVNPIPFITSKEGFLLDMERVAQILHEAGL